MAELIRSITARLREIVGNNRCAPRREARLPVSVTPLDPKARVVGAQLTKLEGHTRDISATGLGLILPAIHVGGHYLTGEDRMLRIALELPPEPIQIEAAPVRYERLEEGETETGYLIGAHIEQMSDVDRARFMQYLKTLH